MPTKQKEKQNFDSSNNCQTVLILKAQALTSGLFFFFFCQMNHIFEGLNVLKLTELVTHVSHG